MSVTDHDTRPDGQVPDASQEPEQPPRLITTDDMEQPDGGLITVEGPQGMLSLSPHQRDLTDAQCAALGAFGLDPKDPQDWPHILVFLHMCQTRGLDPWAQQAYLIKYGGGTDRDGEPRRATYTMVVGINGYRSMAADTRRQIGGARWLWTGNDDSDQSWREENDPDLGETIMRRRWWDQWPDGRGYPGAARAVVKHYDDNGNVVTSDWVANWDMYAPWAPEKAWQSDPTTGRRFYGPVLGSDGQPVMKLSGKWETGPAHMLAKVAEAGALRKVAPRRMSGIYIPEEVDVALAADRARQDEQDADRRREAYAEHQRRQRERVTVHATVEREPGTGAGVNPAGVGVNEPVHEGVNDGVGAVHGGTENAPDPVSAGAQDPGEGVNDSGEDVLDGVHTLGEITVDQQRRWLLEEIAFMADLQGADVGVMLNALGRRIGRVAKDAPPADLLRVVGPFRLQTVVPRLRELGRDEEADAYVHAGPELIAPLHVLLGVPADPGEPAGDDGEGVGVHAFTHAFTPTADDDSLCVVCTRDEGDAVHEGGLPLPADE